jgi:hypothetical protein
MRFRLQKRTLCGGVPLDSVLASHVIVPNEGDPGSYKFYGEGFFCDEAGVHFHVVRDSAEGFIVQCWYRNEDAEDTRTLASLILCPTMGAVAQVFLYDFPFDRSVWTWNLKLVAPTFCKRLFYGPGFPTTLARVFPPRQYFDSLTLANVLKLAFHAKQRSLGLEPPRSPGELWRQEHYHVTNDQLLQIFEYEEILLQAGKDVDVFEVISRTPRHLLPPCLLDALISNDGEDTRTCLLSRGLPESMTERRALLAYA